MPRLPNVLLLVLDTARAQSFSGYGYTRKTTPHMDALAAESVVYEQAIAPGCWSLPAQVSLLTGLFPSTHGAHELHRAYTHAYPLLPEVLREQGYHTLGVSPNSWMSDEFGVTHGFEHYVKLWQYRHQAPASPAGRGWLSRLDRRLNRWYARRIFPYRNQAWHVNHHVRTLLAQVAEPFFMYAIYWDTHLPYAAPDTYLAPWLPRHMTLRQAQAINRDPWRYITGQVAMAEEDLQGLRSCYDAALASLDSEIGRLLDWLRQRRMLEHTLLIITSDHGENLGEHGLMSHAYSLHDTLLHVPLLVRYPACFPPGQRVQQQVQLTDLFPTILDVLGLALPHVRRPLQGHSLLPPVCAPPAPRLAYAEMLGPQPAIASLNRRVGAPETTPRPALDRALRCVRTPDIKCIWASDGAHELYRLRCDPGETRNLFATEPALAREYLSLLQNWQPASPTGVPLPPMDDDVRQRLQALGYLE
ncbi:MAG: sulfatase [Candidatus Tectimicrobiota bacterium]